MSHRLPQGGSVGSQPVQAAREALNNGHQVLDHLSFRAERLSIHDDELALLPLTEMGNEGIPKARKTVRMSKHQDPDSATHDPIHQSKQSFAVKIEATAHFLDPLIDNKTACSAKLLKRLALSGK